MTQKKKIKNFFLASQKLKTTLHLFFLMDFYSIYSKIILLKMDNTTGVGLKDTQDQPSTNPPPTLHQPYTFV
jgi:hypothetical protein